MKGPSDELQSRFRQDGDGVVDTTNVVEEATTSIRTQHVADRQPAEGPPQCRHRRRFESSDSSSLDLVVSSSYDHGASSAIPFMEEAHDTHPPRVNSETCASSSASSSCSSSMECSHDDDDDDDGREDLNLTARTAGDEPEPPVPVLSVNMFSMYATGECAIPPAEAGEENDDEGFNSEEEEEAPCSRRSSRSSPSQHSRHGGVAIERRNKQSSPSDESAASEGEMPPSVMHSSETPLDIGEKSIRMLRSFGNEEAATVLAPQPSSPTPPELAGPKGHRRVKTLPTAATFSLELDRQFADGAALSAGSAGRPDGSYGYGIPSRAGPSPPSSVVPEVSARHHRRTQTIPPALGRCDWRSSRADKDGIIPLPAAYPETTTTLLRSRSHKCLTAHTSLGEMMRMCGEKASHRRPPPARTHRRVQTLPTSVIAEMVGTRSIGRPDQAWPDLPRRAARPAGGGLPPRGPNALARQGARPSPSPAESSGRAPHHLSPHAPLHERVADWSASTGSVIGRAPGERPPYMHKRSSSAPLLLKSPPPRDDSRRRPPGGGVVNALGDLSQLANYLPTNGDDGDTPDPKLLAGRRRRHHHHHHRSSQSRDSSSHHRRGSSAEENTAATAHPPSSDDNINVVSAEEQSWNAYYERQRLKKNIVKDEIKYRLGKVVPRQFVKRAELKRANSAKLV